MAVKTVLDGCAALQVLFDLGRVLAVEPLQFLVELHVSLVDVVDVGVFIERTTTTVLGSLRYSQQTTNKSALTLRETCRRTRRYKTVITIKWHHFQAYLGQPYDLRSFGVDLVVAEMPSYECQINDSK